MEDFTNRVGSVIALPALLDNIASSYALGDIIASVPILIGYQDYNVDLTTSKGRYVVKIFSKEKSKERIDDVVWAYAHSAKLGVPVAQIIQTPDKRPVIEISGDSRPVYACVFAYFPSKPLTRVPVTDTDLDLLTNAMAAIHRIPKTVHRYYDTLGIINLTDLYKKNNAALNTEELAIITPVVAKMSKIDFSAFPHSIIHGTFEKENVLKNPTGEIRLLDFGCMDYNASILDIATYIANFTLYLDDTRRTHVAHRILEVYEQSRPLTSAERAALPTLIRSQFAAHAIHMTYYMRIDHDMTKQTQTWLDRGWDGLRTYASVKKIL